jgi:hypothetical protein
MPAKLPSWLRASPSHRDFQLRRSPLPSSSMEVPVPGLGCAPGDSGCSSAPCQCSPVQLLETPPDCSHRKTTTQPATQSCLLNNNIPVCFDTDRTITLAPTPGAAGPMPTEKRYSCDDCEKQFVRRKFCIVCLANLPLHLIDLSKVIQKERLHRVQHQIPDPATMAPTSYRCPVNTFARMLVLTHVAHCPQPSICTGIV